MFGADGGTEAQQDEYLRATLKKAGLPEHLEVTEMEIEYGVKDTSDNIWLLPSRAEAEEAAEAEDDTVVVREAIHTAWRPVTPRASS